MLVHLDHEHKNARLLLKAQPILETLMAEEAANPKFVSFAFFCNRKNFLKDLLIVIKKYGRIVDQ